MKQSLDDMVILEGNNELNIQMVPVAVPPLEAMITGVNWTVTDFPFSWYGEGPVVIAKFIKAQVSVQSSVAFKGRIEFHHPDIISRVPVIAEAEYQAYAAEIDYNIANNVPPGSSWWQLQKDATLPYPAADGFRIDFGNFDKSGWWWMFTQDWLDKGQSSFSWDVDIPEGNSAVVVGFFKRHGVGIGLPGLLQLYSDDALQSYLDTGPGALADVPALLSASWPDPVQSGAAFDITSVFYLPLILGDNTSWIVRFDAYTNMGLKINLGGVGGLVAPSLYDKVLQYDPAMAATMLRLDNANGRYEVVAPSRATFRQDQWHPNEPVPPGSYIVTAVAGYNFADYYPGQGFGQGYPQGLFELGQVGVLVVV